MNLRQLLGTTALVVALPTAAIAQYSGKLPPNTMLGNPLGVSSPARPIGLPSILKSLLGNANAYTYYAQAYGSCPIWDATHDVSPCINAAIAAASAGGGGRVVLPVGTFGLLSTITPVSLVTIAGAGGAGAGQCATTLKWLGNGTAGVAGGTIIKTGSSTASTKVYRSGLHDMCIDGNDLAANGVEEWSIISNYSARVYLQNTTAIGWLLDEANHPTVPATDMNSHLNTYTDIQIAQASAAAINGVCFKVGQNSVNSSDASANKWRGFQCQHQNGIAWDFGAGDSNEASGVWLQALGVGTTGKGLVLRGSSVSGRLGAFGNYFGDIAAGNGSHASGGIWAETGSVSEASNNKVAFVKTGDGEPAPTDQTTTGTGVFWCNDAGYCNSNRPNRRNPTGGGVTLTGSDSGSFVSTNGAASAQTAHLPAALGLGANFCFAQTDQQIIVQPAATPGTDIIRIGSDVTGAGLTVASSTAGAALCLISIKSGEWLAKSVTGSWTVNH